MIEQIKKLKDGKIEKSSELLSTSKSYEAQTIEFSTSIPQTTRMPYRQPNYKSCYEQHQSQEENKKCSSYIQTNYNIEKERRQYRQLLWKPKMRSSIQLVDRQIVLMKVDLGWITPQKI